MRSNRYFAATAVLAGSVFCAAALAQQSPPPAVQQTAAADLPPDLVAMADDDPETAFVLSVLGPAQEVSLTEGNAVCGHLLYVAEVDFGATYPKEGVGAACELDPPAPDMEAFAMFRTLGHAEDMRDPEVPAISALEQQGQLDTYQSTPGGRVWLISPSEGIAFLVCDAGCVGKSPKYDPESHAPVKSEYSINTLRARFAMNN